MTDELFEAAADAIVAGDLPTLERLLSEYPELVHARSERPHHATLLHYVSANGVEEARQKTPPNIVALAELLLRAGAEVDATADVYGGGCTTLGLTATSIHPERAGVQRALLETLLRFGANPDIRSAGHGHSMVTACLANNRLPAARFFAARGSALTFADMAALGRLEEIRESLDEAFVNACRFGQSQVANFLLKRGANLTAQDKNGQTGLHWAAIGAHLETVELLLAHRAPLEIENKYGGTPLGQAEWSAAHSDHPNAYEPIIAALRTAGAGRPS